MAAKRSSKTLTRRPDLVSRATVREYLSGVNVAVIAETGNINLAGVSETCRAYGAGRPYIVSESREVREKMKELSPEAKIVGSVRKILERLDEDTLIVKVSGSSRKNELHSLEAKRICLEHGGEVLFIFAEDEEKFESFAGITGYLYDGESEIPMCMKIGIALDRFLGKR